MTLLWKCNVCMKTYQTDEATPSNQCPHCGSIGARIKQRLYAFLSLL